MDGTTINVGEALAARSHTTDEVQLFLYNAALWNPHRIHYDHRYATGVEGHPELVIDGPLQGDWLCQMALEWAEQRGELTGFSYRNQRAAYLGETLVAGGTVSAVDGDTVTLSLHLTNSRGEVTTPATATVHLTPPGHPNHRQ